MPQIEKRKILHRLYRLTHKGVQDLRRCPRATVKRMDLMVGSLHEMNASDQIIQPIFSDQILIISPSEIGAVFDFETERDPQRRKILPGLPNLPAVFAQLPERHPASRIPVVGKRGMVGKSKDLKGVFERGGAVFIRGSGRMTAVGRMRMQIHLFQVHSPFTVLRMDPRIS